MSTRSARAQLLAAALLFSSGGTVIKAVALTNWQVAAGRSLFAAFVIALGGAGLWRQFSWRPVLVGALIIVAATIATWRDSRVPVLE